jgi:alkylhydroperoxidase family enzyme
MPRIPPADNTQFPLEEVSGVNNMSDLFRTMAHRPDLAKYSMQLLEVAMRGGTVNPALKELLAVRVSQVNHCFY